MFKFIIILFIIFFVFGKLFKFILKMLLANAIQKHVYGETRTVRKEGSIHVEQTKQNKSSKKDSGGEYIDFEVIN